MTMNIYNFLRSYLSERWVRKPRDFKLWEKWFMVQYLDACISYRARELSLDDNTAFARHQTELASDVAFQEKAWSHFLQTVDKLDKENQQLQLMYKQDGLGNRFHSTLNIVANSCVVPPSERKYKRNSNQCSTIKAPRYSRTV